MLFLFCGFSCPFDHLESTSEIFPDFIIDKKPFSSIDHRIGVIHDLLSVSGYLFNETFSDKIYKYGDFTVDLLIHPCIYGIVVYICFLMAKTIAEPVEKDYKIYEIPMIEDITFDSLNRIFIESNPRHNRLTSFRIDSFIWNELMNDETIAEQGISLQRSFFGEIGYEIDPYVVVRLSSKTNRNPKKGSLLYDDNWY